MVFGEAVAQEGVICARSATEGGGDCFEGVDEGGER